MSRLKKIFIQQAFRPGATGLLINPFYVARKGLYRNVSALAPLVTGRVLDVGCGHKPYQSLFASSSYVGLELDTPVNRREKRADVFYDGTRFPFDANCFDTVLLSEVLEHVFAPDEFLAEVNRVLKPGGGLLITVPFVWDEHEQPFDYARYTSFGLRHLLAQHAFQVVESRKSVADGSVICQMIACYLHAQVANWRPAFKAAAWVAFSAPLNLLAEVVARVTPRNPNLYLGNVMFARKVDGGQLTAES